MMNHQSANLDSTSDFDVDGIFRPAPRAIPYEINNVEIETIVSAALPYGNRPTAALLLFFPGNDSSRGVEDERSNATDVRAVLELMNNESTKTNNDLSAAAAAGAPIIDEYVLDELRDAENGYDDTPSNGTSFMRTATGAKKRKNKNSGSESEDTQAAIKKSKIAAARDPNAVSKVVSWDTWFAALLNYCAESGTCNVPRTKSFTITDGRMMKLGEWVNTQRRQKILGTLAPERVAKLDALVAEGKFVWSLQWVPAKNSPCDGAEQLAAVSEQMITVHQALWNLNYQSLLYFCEAYGHSNVPYHFSQPFIAGHPTPLHLGYWLHRQRRMRCIGKLQPDRLALLEALAVEEKGAARLQWDMGSAFLVNDGTWDQMCLALETYAATFAPHQQIPTGMSLSLPNPEGGPDLKVGSWLKKQRQRRQDGGMKVEREARLQVLVDAGKIKWSAQNAVLKEREPNSAASITSLSEDKKWNKIYDLLHAYGMSQGGGEGCCNIHLKGSVMNGSTGKTSTLGVWLMRQRRQKAKGWIHPLREIKLQGLVDKGMLSWDLDLPKMKPGRKMGNKLPINANGAYVVYVQENSGRDSVEDPGSAGQGLSRAPLTSNEMFPGYTGEAVHSMQPLHGLTDNDNNMNANNNNGNINNNANIIVDDNDGSRTFKDINSSYYSQNMNFNPINGNNNGKMNLSVNQLIPPTIPHPVPLPYVPSPYFTSFTPTQTPPRMHSSEAHLGAI